MKNETIEVSETLLLGCAKTCEGKIKKKIQVFLARKTSQRTISFSSQIEFFIKTSTAYFLHAPYTPSIIKMKHSLHARNIGYSSKTRYCRKKHFVTNTKTLYSCNQFCPYCSVTKSYKHNQDKSLFTSRTQLSNHHGICTLHAKKQIVERQLLLLDHFFGAWKRITSNLGLPSFTARSHGVTRINSDIPTKHVQSLRWSELRIE